MNPNKNYTRLPLKNCRNVRDLGGYACKNGLSTKWHAFLRSDNPADLTEPEIAFLREYGLSTVIDLRSSGEAKAHPNIFQNMPGITLHHTPLGVEDMGDVTKMVAENPEQFMKDFYRDIITKTGASIGEILSTMANAPDGCILFHCAAGKDRTGVLAMLLLALAGVSRGDIIANYQITFTFIQQDPVLSKMLSKYPSVLMESRPEFLEAAIDCIGDTYGGIDSYLRSIGVTAEAQRRLLNRIVE